MIDPRLQVLYLLAVGVVAFATAHPAVLLGLLGLQVALWLYLGLPAADLLTIFRKLVVFFVFIVVSFAFFAPEPGDRLVAVPVLVGSVDLNLSGILRGLLLSSRVVTVIYASQILQRTGDRGSLVRGLRGWFVPAPIAYSLDLVLALLGVDERRGGGGGRRRRAREAEADGSAPEGADKERTLDVLRRVLRGDVGFLLDLMARHIARAREQAATYGLKPEALSDLAVITGLAVLSMTLRFLKVMPGLPVAPGHKGIILLPLYIVAAELTASRWGATQLGVVIGVTSFLMGEGKFGLFEIPRHVTPGLFVDLVMPLVRLLRPNAGAFVYALVGVGAAVTRLSTLLLVAYFVEAPSIFYAFLIPMVVSNTVFGFLSGFVTYHLMRSVQKLRAVL
jgi:energy-coupling factor transporter transmembrane protein EcfT